MIRVALTIVCFYDVRCRFALNSVYEGLGFICHPSVLLPFGVVWVCGFLVVFWTSYPCGVFVDGCLVTYCV